MVIGLLNLSSKIQNRFLPGERVDILPVYSLSSFLWSKDMKCLALLTVLSALVASLCIGFFTVFPTVFPSSTLILICSSSSIFILLMIAMIVEWSARP